MTAPAPNHCDAIERFHDCAVCPLWDASGCETADGRVCRCACHDATVTPDSAHRAADALGLHIVAADGAEVLA